MAKLARNDFADKHPNAPAFTPVVTSSFPLKLDSSRKKLPTPYSLLLEWVDQHVQGDWAATVLGTAKKQSVFAVKLP